MHWRYFTYALKFPLLDHNQSTGSAYAIPPPAPKPRKHCLCSSMRIISDGKLLFLRYPQAMRLICGCFRSAEVAGTALHLASKYFLITHLLHFPKIVGDGNVDMTRCTAADLMIIDIFIRDPQTGGRVAMIAGRTFRRYVRDYNSTGQHSSQGKYLATQCLHPPTHLDFPIRTKPTLSHRRLKSMGHRLSGSSLIV